MNHVNCDWYQILNYFTLQHEKIKEWIHEVKLRKMHFAMEKGGVTVVSRKSLKKFELTSIDLPPFVNYW